MTDLVDRLRDRACEKIPDRLAAEAADEIERLRLTDAEREAAKEAIKAFDEFAGDEVYATALRGLLERTK